MLTSQAENTRRGKRGERRLSLQKKNQMGHGIGISSSNRHVGSSRSFRQTQQRVGRAGLNRGLTRCIGGCSTLDSCESASGAGRIDTSEAARFALRGDAFSAGSDRLARALARWRASGQHQLGGGALLLPRGASAVEARAAFAGAPQSGMRTRLLTS